VTKSLSDFFDNTIGAGIMAIIVFTPLAFGAVGPKALAISEIIIFSTFGVWLLKGSLVGGITRIRGVLFIFPILFIALAFMQSLPLPLSILLMLSPNSAAVYSELGGYGLSDTASISLYAAATRAEALRLLSVFLFFILMVDYLSTKERIRRIAIVMTALGVAVAVFAVIQKLTWNGYMYWFYPVPSGVSSGVGQVWGPYLNHNHFAGLMEMIIPVSLGLFLIAAARIQLRSRQSFSKNLIRLTSGPKLLTLAIFFFAAIIMGVVLLLSLSRGGMLGLASALIVLIFLSLRINKIRSRVLLALGLGLVILTLVGVSSWNRVEPRFAELTDKSYNISRDDIWLESLEIVKDYPLLGSGLGTFRYVYPMYQMTNSKVFFAHAENEYLEFLTDTGVVGVSLVLGIIVSFFFIVVRGWFRRSDVFLKSIAAGAIASCVAIMVHGLTDFNTRIPANMFILSVTAALAYACVFRISSGKGIKEGEELK
jgi:O-antigen ligase